MFYKLKGGNFKIEVVTVDRDYVYYKNCGCYGVEMMTLDYLNRHYEIINKTTVL